MASFDLRIEKECFTKIGESVALITSVLPRTAQFCQFVTFGTACLPASAGCLKLFFLIESAKMKK